MAGTRAFRRAGWGTAAFPGEGADVGRGGAFCWEAVAPGRPGARPHPCGGGEGGRPEGSGQPPCQSSRVGECKMRRGEVGLTLGGERGGTSCPRAPRLGGAGASRSAWTGAAVCPRAGDPRGGWAAASERLGHIEQPRPSRLCARRPLPSCRRVPGQEEPRGQPVRPNLEPGPHVCSWRWASSLGTDLTPADVSILGTDSRQSLGRGSRTWSRLDFVAGREVGRGWLILGWRGETLRAVLRAPVPPPSPKTQAYA